MKSIFYISLLVCLLLVAGCQAPNPQKPEDIASYFLEVALGSEYGPKTQPARIQKWNQPIYYYLHGKPHANYKAELLRVIHEIEVITTTLCFYPTTDLQQANLHIVLGNRQAYHSHAGDLYPLLEKNLGFFRVETDSNGNITSASMFVDVYRARSKAVYHLIREELTQLLGLMQDSYRYRQSIFYAGYSTTTTYASIDKILLRLLYHPHMPSNADANRAYRIALECLEQCHIVMNTDISASN